jgi:hypothetical protein
MRVTVDLTPDHRWISQELFVVRCTVKKRPWKLLATTSETPRKSLGHDMTSVWRRVGFVISCINVSSTRPETLPVWAWV